MLQYDFSFKLRKGFKIPKFKTMISFQICSLRQANFYANLAL